MNVARFPIDANAVTRKEVEKALVARVPLDTVKRPPFRLGDGATVRENSHVLADSQFRRQLPTLHQSNGLGWQAAP